MSDYRVELSSYAGPLDLLLFLVKRNEIDLNDIPISKLTDQYLAYVEKMEIIDINVASEFLVMAATLLEIKSKMISPPPEEDEQEGEEDKDSESTVDTDPRYALVQQLLAYKKYKDAAMQLELLQEEYASRFPNKPAKVNRALIDGEDEAESKPIELDMEDVGIQDLCEAFARMLETIGQNRATHDILDDDTPISLHAEDIADRLIREGPMTLQQIFVGRRNRAEMIGLFMATLELVKERRIIVKQDAPGSELHLEIVSEEEQMREIRAQDEHEVFEDDEQEETEGVTGTEGATRKIDGEEGEDDQESELSPEEIEAAKAKKKSDLMNQNFERWRNPETGEVEFDWPDEESKKRAMRRQKLRKTLEGKKNADESAEEQVKEKEAPQETGEPESLEAQETAGNDQPAIAHDDDVDDYDDDEEILDL